MNGVVRYSGRVDVISSTSALMKRSRTSPDCGMVRKLLKGVLVFEIHHAGTNGSLEEGLGIGKGNLHAELFVPTLRQPSHVLG